MLTKPIAAVPQKARGGQEPAAAIPPGNGQRKRKQRMDRNRFLGVEGDPGHALLSAVGMNVQKQLRWAAGGLRYIFCWLLGSQRKTGVSVFTET